MSGIKTQQITLASKEAYKIFKISAELADTMEDVLEDHAQYNPEFITGLKLSLKQARSGKLKKIKSLKGLR